MTTWTDFNSNSRILLVPENILNKSSVQKLNDREQCNWHVFFFNSDIKCSISTVMKHICFIFVNLFKSLSTIYLKLITSHITIFSSSKAMCEANLGFFQNIYHSKIKQEKGSYNKVEKHSCKQKKTGKIVLEIIAHLYYLLNKI